MGKTLKDIFVAIWLMLAFFPAMGLAGIMVLYIFFGNIVPMIENGFSQPPVSMATFFILSIPIFLTDLLSKRCYELFPGLYPVSHFLYANYFILALTELVLSKGMQVHDSFHYILSIILASLVFAVCRLAWSFYCQKHPFDRSFYG